MRPCAAGIGIGGFQAVWSLGLLVPSAWLLVECGGYSSAESLDVRRYFLAAGFVLSCLGFMFFLSFFCELFPLPIFGSPVCG
jgi:hypothetical protein